jgi:hypothetical protein
MHMTGSQPVVLAQADIEVAGLLQANNEKDTIVITSEQGWW